MSSTHEFERSYWTEDSQYRKFDGFEAAVGQLERWYAGFIRLIEPHLPPAGSRVVDAGCGHGAIVRMLKTRGLDAVGFDASRWIVEQAQASMPDGAQTFAVGDVADVPFAGDFDLIVCLEVLEHLDDPVTALAALAGRLRPGGRLIASTPNLRPLMPWWDPLTSDPTHVSVHEPAWWREAVRRGGLEPEHVGTFLAVPLLWHLGPAWSCWVPTGGRAGPGVLIVARRPDA